MHWIVPSLDRFYIGIPTWTDKICAFGGILPGTERLWHSVGMDLFPIARTSWSPGDTREVEQSRVQREIGMEYDSYRRVYIAEGHEWRIAGQIAREDGKKYYILECVE